ncbi:hypothetical protein OHA70_10955 [Kribbella sp. NBC_00382]|uniref:hypothetical protein n=1 Tax=Kribbella sp. NBC_00382 TaxID=2975967 RepID=UPI002E1FE8C2
MTALGGVAMVTTCLADLSSVADGFGLVYGSSVTRDARTAPSDLDFVLVTAEPLTDQLRATLATGIRQAHSGHGLPIDQEVPYENKLTATYEDVAAACSLTCFPQLGSQQARPVTESDPYLYSEDFRLRLLLNALTTPHALIWGSIEALSTATAAAEQAVARLGLMLTMPTADFTAEPLVEALLRSPAGAEGKDYLGFSSPVHLFGVVSRGLAAMSDAGLVAPAGAGLWRFDSAGSQS